MNHLDFIEYHTADKDSLHNKVHVHNDSYEILHVVEGEGVFLVGDTLYPLIPNAIYLVNSVQLHCSHVKDKCNYVRSKLAINATYLDRVLEALEISTYIKTLFDQQNGQYLLLSAKSSAQIDELFKSLYKYSQENTPSSKAKQIITLVNILLICKSVAVDAETKSERDPNSLIARTIKYINLNISSELTIDMIAKDIFISKYYLCRSFKKHLGISIMKYILSQRLALAKEQLVSTNNKCSDIAMSTGFSSFSYFCRVFRELEGISPTRYRQLHGDKAKK